MRPDLAVDVGQTGLRVATASNGQVDRVWTGDGVTDRADPGGTLLAALTRAVGELGDEGYSTVAIGLTSVLGDSDSYRRLAERLLEALAAQRVMLCGDVVTAHAGALAGAPGVVLAAGTGAIALALTDDGTARQVDGWGHHFGDAGGGYWIGSRGIDAAMRCHDGRGPTTALTPRAAAIFGDLDTIAENLYSKPHLVRVIAGFAREVLELAATDETAGRIVADAGAELSDTVTAAARLWPPDASVTVSATGNLLTAPALSAAFSAYLRERAPHLRLVPPAADGLGGAALLASMADPGRYGKLMRAVVRR
ncbi:MAG TPA: BadF/BadG/BcrA/BcrD ATPase family protein [Candidatus Limnocylindrales bacterium]